jgi:hypothetical protein
LELSLFADSEPFIFCDSSQDKDIGLEGEAMEGKLLDHGHEWGADQRLHAYNAIVKACDISTLDTGRWLNDEIINAYTGHLGATRAKSFAAHVETSFFSTALLKKGYKHTTRWLKSVDLFSQDYFICTVNQDQKHWSLCIVANLSSTTSLAATSSTGPARPTAKARSSTEEIIIVTMDSLDHDGVGFNARIAAELRHFVLQEARIKLGLDLDPDHVVWKHAHHLPLQENNADCGVFVCIYLEQFLENPADFLACLDTTPASSTCRIDADEGRRRIRDTITNLLQLKEPSCHANEGASDTTTEEASVSSPAHHQSLIQPDQAAGHGLAVVDTSKRDSGGEAFTTLGAIHQFIGSSGLEAADNELLSARGLLYEYFVDRTQLEAVCTRTYTNMRKFATPALPAVETVNSESGKWNDRCLPLPPPQLTCCSRFVYL